MSESQIGAYQLQNDDEGNVTLGVPVPEASKFEMNSRPLAIIDDYPYSQEDQLSNTRNMAL